MAELEMANRDITSIIAPLPFSLHDGNDGTLSSCATSSRPFDILVHRPQYHVPWHLSQRRLASFAQTVHTISTSGRISDIGMTHPVFRTVVALTNRLGDNVQW